MAINQNINNYELKKRNLNLVSCIAEDITVDTTSSSNINKKSDSSEKLKTVILYT